MSDVMRAPVLPAERRAVKKALPGHFSADKHVWVFIVQEPGQVHPISWKLTGAGRKLAEKRKLDLAAVVIGPEGDAAPRSNSSPTPRPCPSRRRQHARRLP
nr:hypothetical protein [Bradyrhizobium murdochi]